MLGFLPRELAKFLSPLIEKCCLSFKVPHFFGLHDNFHAFSIMICFQIIFWYNTLMCKGKNIQIRERKG